MGIAKELHQLLYCHDCVIVPQWGGFLTQYKSARLDEGRKVIHPPGKDLSFNRNLVRNDGILADHIAKREGISFDSATSKINAEVAKWRAALDQQGRVEVPHIGIFYRDSARNLQFDPDKRANFLKDAYGLRPIAAVHLESEGTVIRTLQPLVLMPAEKSSSIFWAAAASVALLLGASAFWYYNSGMAQSGMWSGLDPVATPQRTYVAPTDNVPRVAALPEFTLPIESLGVQRIPLSADEGTTIVVDLGTPVAEKTLVEPEKVVTPPKNVVVAPTPPPSVEVPKVSKRFHLIGGCFAQPENADRMLEKMKGAGHSAIRLSIRNGLHPVAFGSYATREEALDTLEALRKDPANAAWLLIR